MSLFIAQKSNFWADGEVLLLYFEVVEFQSPLIIKSPKFEECSLTDPHPYKAPNHAVPGIFQQFLTSVFRI
jgi:hypothetical protein